jgi:hypothetical protein
MLANSQTTSYAPSSKVKAAAELELRRRHKAERLASIDLDELHAAQRQVAHEARRFNVLDCGRRFGKTLFGLNRAKQMLRKGLPVGWFAPTYKLMLDVWTDARRALVDEIVTANKTEMRLELHNGAVFDMWTLDNIDAGRGRKYARVIIDEAAMVKNLMGAWQSSIRPTLTDLKGDAWFLSTPKGRNGFWHLYQMGIDPTRTDWAAWQMPTSANPYIDGTEIEAAREMLPELTFEQEYLAVFLESEGAVFRNIAACMHAPETTPEQHKDHIIVAGVDWAKQRDFTTFSLGCVTCRQEVARDRFNQIDYVFQRARLQVLCDLWKPKAILTETNSIGTPIFEELERARLPVVAFETTASSKPPLIENLALTLERTEWQFQADATWTAELEGYERTVSPVTGRSSYSAPEDGHDDTVMARALMVWQANQRGNAVVQQSTVRGREYKPMVRRSTRRAV